MTADFASTVGGRPAARRADPLLSPLSIRHLTLKNRIMSTSHACGLEEGGMPTERYQLYHEEKAKGGLALTMFGGSSNVAPDSPNIFRQLNVGVDEVIPWLQTFSDRIHAHGAALMCQITHLGRRGEPYATNWLPTIAPSPIRETLHRSFPKEMDEHDIRRVVKAYGAAAKRCKEGGLDGIETLAGGHLIGQFLSPSMNRRADKYGGPVENRCRFGLMVYEEMRRRPATASCSACATSSTRVRLGCRRMNAWRSRRSSSAAGTSISSTPSTGAWTLRSAWRSTTCRAWRRRSRRG